MVAGQARVLQRSQSPRIHRRLPLQLQHQREYLPHMMASGLVWEQLLV